jgi:MFS family permease
VFSLYAITAAFCTYACMYAFRKPIATGEFADFAYWGIDLKTLLIVAQVIGYTVSKFIGIKVVSEMLRHRRAVTILGLVALAELALFFFWIVPAPWNIGFLFLNGLPLGIIWGLVFSYLEGRRNTELLGAGLSVSFIVSTGMVKSVGAYLMYEWGVSEFAMPFLTGAIFLLPLLFFTWLLDRLPPPTAEDERLRVRREPMDGPQRIAFFKRFGGGIVVLTLAYLFLTAFRDLRDNYSREILDAIGFADNAAIFVQTEIPIAIIVLGVMGSLMLIKDNKRALMANHVIIFTGLVMVGASTALFSAGWISPYFWMVLVGLGSYLGYVPFNCILFDRLIATFRTVANAGFLIYIADAFGYLSSVGVLLFKNFGYAEISWYSFFVGFCYATALVGGSLTLVSAVYFLRR